MPIEELVDKEGSGLLARLEALRGKLQWHPDSASDGSDSKTAAVIAGQIVKLEELVAKATGEFARHTARKTVTHVHRREKDARSLTRLMGRYAEHFGRLQIGLHRHQFRRREIQMFRWTAIALLAFAVSVPAVTMSGSSAKATTIVIKKKHHHPFMHEHRGRKVIIKKRGGDED